jgi:hypothetical protein
MAAATSCTAINQSLTFAEIKMTAASCMQINQFKIKMASAS